MSESEQTQAVEGIARVAERMYAEHDHPGSALRAYMLEGAPIYEQNLGSADAMPSASALAHVIPAVLSGRWSVAGRFGRR